jgi:hypothetical protein
VDWKTDEQRGEEAPRRFDLPKAVQRKSIQKAVYNVLFTDPSGVGDIF